MDTNAIKQVLDSGTGIALKEYLKSKLNELRDINNLKEKDVVAHQAIEFKAQKRAYTKLKEILEEIMSFAGEVKKKDPRDSFDVGAEDD